MLRSLLLIGIFGAAGAILRYLVGFLPALHHLPTATILVNLIGSFLLGWITGWTLDNNQLPETWKVGITTGFLGALTTFSTFTLENARLIQQGHLKSAFFNITVQVVIGVMLAMYGISLGMKSNSGS